MIVLGLDFSTHTGLCAISFDGNNAYRVLDSREVTAPKTLKGMSRADYIACEVVTAVESYAPEFVVLEDYAPKFMGSAIVNIEITAVSKYMLHQMAVGYWKVPAPSLKKFVTGKGACPKDIMIKEVYKRWGFDSNNNNVVDAFSLAMFGGALQNAINCNKEITEYLAKFAAQRDKYWCN